MTGPAGFSADASKAFEGINTTLLFATVGLVFLLLVLIYGARSSGQSRSSPCCSPSRWCAASATCLRRPAP